MTSRLQSYIAGGSIAVVVGVGALGPAAPAGATTTEGDDAVLVDRDEVTTAAAEGTAPDSADEEQSTAPVEDQSPAEEDEDVAAPADDSDVVGTDGVETDGAALEDVQVEDVQVEEGTTAEAAVETAELVVAAADGGPEAEADQVGAQHESGDAGGEDVDDVAGAITDPWLEGVDSGAGRCDGDQTYALAEIFLAQGHDRRFIMQGDVRVVDLTTALDAGDYIIDTYSWDEHENRPHDIPQASERYYVELVDAEGNVVGSTGATTDLPDDVVRGESYDTFEVTLSGTAVQMRIIHIQDYITTGSVVPGCLSVSAVVEPEPETPPTTVPETPTTTVPETPVTTTPPATTPTTEAPTTTQPEVEVDDAVATLPHTGSNTIGLTVVGSSLIVAGLGFTIISRRRLGAIV